MVSNRYLAAVAAQLMTTLHPANGNVRCWCGACRHRILFVARQNGVPTARLIAALPAERALEAKRAPRARRGGDQVVNVMTVTRGRARAHGVAGVVALTQR